MSQPEVIVHKATPEQSARLAKLAALVESERPDLAARLEREDIAAAQPTFSGELRRAIRASFLQPGDLARDAGVDWQDFALFLQGRAELSTRAIDLLASRLGLSLVKLTAETSSGN
jgi:hypothetical protein